jgi:hypothetical protein
MDGDQFDAVTKAAMRGGRRAALRNLGLLTGGFATLLGASEVDAQGRKRGARTKKRRGGTRAEAKPENPAGSPFDCCAPCPATGNECTIAVRDASTGRCEQVPLRSSLPCGTGGTCGSDGVCYQCFDTLCPAPNDPSGETLFCANLDHEANACGSCDHQCNLGEESCCFGTCCPIGTHMCFCDGPGGQNCSCQPFPSFP